MNKKIISFALVFLFIFFASDIAFPWNRKSHREISSNAINISQLPQYFENELGFSFSSKRFSGPVHRKSKLVIEEFSDYKNYTDIEWIKHGSGAEDKFYIWCCKLCMF